MASFNCGKMIHIFKYAKNDTGKFMYTDEFESDDTKEAFINGDFYLKVHGECGWISQSGEAYRRNQTLQPTVPVGNKALENGSNSSTYRDDIYSLKAVPVIFDEIENLPTGKREKKLCMDRAKAVQEASERISNLNGNGASVEWIGTKIQKTPGIMREAGFIFHHDLRIEKFGLERDIIKEDLKQFFRNHIVEGLVIRHPSGEYFKIRSNMLIENDPHEFAVKVWSSILKKGEKDEKTAIEALEKACNAKFISYYHSSPY